MKRSRAALRHNARNEPAGRPARSGDRKDVVEGKSDGLGTRGTKRAKSTTAEHRTDLPEHQANRLVSCVVLLVIFVRLVPASRGPRRRVDGGLRVHGAS